MGIDSKIDLKKEKKWIENRIRNRFDIRIEKRNSLEYRLEDKSNIESKLEFILENRFEFLT